MSDLDRAEQLAAGGDPAKPYTLLLLLSRMPTDEELDRVVGAACTNPHDTDEEHDCLLEGASGTPACPECLDPLYRGHACEPEGGWAPVVARVRALTDAGNTLAAAAYRLGLGGQALGYAAGSPAAHAWAAFDAWRALVGDADKAPEAPVSPVQPREPGQPIPLSSDAPDGADAHNGKGAA